MRRSVSERVQPSKQHQPKEEYPPPEKEVLNAKIFDCIHNAQSGHINEFSGTARRKRGSLEWRKMFILTTKLSDRAGGACPPKPTLS